MADELIGTIVGGYEILKQIGQGGMATVYLAEQKSMNRKVALKMLPQQFLNDDTYLQRFEQEVQIVSKLEHRNIVPVYDYGEYDSRPYIVMRYMAGGTLDDIIHNGPLDPGGILRIVQQVAPALDYAHSKSVLHRDLKPSNVLLDDDGGAYLTDFGIARVLGQQGPGITTQGVVGTPSYMSPEQAQARPLDGRSDLYSLGVMIFEMATGRRPFEADTPYGVAVLQVTQHPPAPRSLNPIIPSSVEHVILKSMRKTPEERYGTAADLVENLRRAIENPESVHDTQPKLQRPPSITQYQPLPPSAAVPSPGTPPPQSQPQSHYARPSSHAGRPVPYPQATGPAPRRRKRSSPWLSVAIGGMIGCGLLALLTLVAYLALGAMTGEPVATQSGQVSTPPAQTGENNGAIATLDPASEAARQTLVARNTAIEASLTAEQAVTATVKPDILPAALRGTPTLESPLRGATGSIIFFDRRQGSFEVIRLNLTTWIETQLTLDASTNTYPVASPDGLWVVFQSDRSGSFEIYVMNTGGGQIRQLTFNEHVDRLPSWSPDGEWIIYSSDPRGDGALDLYRVRPDGTDNQLVFSNNGRNSHARYSPDGRYIVFTTGADPQDSRTWEIAMLDTQNMEAGARLLTNNNVRDASPVFSPDGQTILYITFHQGDYAIATMNLDGSNQRILYDAPGFEWAAEYSPDGQFIIFTTTVNDEDQLFLMTADGSYVQQITSTGGAYASWIPTPGS